MRTEKPLTLSIPAKAIVTFVATMEGIDRNRLLEAIIVAFAAKSYPKEAVKVFGSGAVQAHSTTLEKVFRATR